MAKKTKEDLIREERARMEAQGYHFYKVDYHLITKPDKKRYGVIGSLPTAKERLCELFEMLYQKPRSVIETITDLTKGEKI